MQQKWLFFDIGETLISEHKRVRIRNDQTFALLKERRPGLTAAEFNVAYRSVLKDLRYGDRAKITQIAQKILGKGAGGIWEEYVSRFLEDTEMDESRNPNRYFELFPETHRVLEHLQSRYQLGVIANQKIWARERVVKHFGLDRYFRVMALSDEIGLSKPDLGIFHYALDAAKAQPSDAWMVGDRIDNDILPANALGMGTVRISHAITEDAVIKPKAPAEVAKMEITDLSEMLKAF